MTLEHDPGTDSTETDALVERLVRAGRADGPSAKALAAAPAAVATLLSGQAAAAAGLTPALGALAPAGKATASPLVLLTWVGLSAGVTAATLAVGSAFWKAPPTAAPAAVVLDAGARRSGLALPASGSAPPPAVVETPRSAGPTPSPVVAPASPALASAPRGDVSREVALLDAARQALVDGSPSRALGILGTLERLPRRALAPEATVLRVRALLAEGSPTEARRVAEAYCDAAPSSPQASVLRALIADSEIRAAPSRL